MFKKDMPRIVFRPTRGLRRLFVAKCKRKNVSQDLALIELVNLWIKDSVKIPGE